MTVSRWMPWLNGGRPTNLRLYDLGNCRHDGCTLHTLPGRDVCPAHDPATDFAAMTPPRKGTRR